MNPTGHRTLRRMEYKYGTAVSPGVAIGPALVLDSEGVLIPHRTVPRDQVDAEIVRLHDALQKRQRKREKPATA